MRNAFGFEWIMAQNVSQALFRLQADTKGISAEIENRRGGAYPSLGGARRVNFLDAHGPTGLQRDCVDGG